METTEELLQRIAKLETEVSKIKNKLQDIETLMKTHERNWLSVYNFVEKIKNRVPE